MKSVHDRKVKVQVQVYLSEKNKKELSFDRDSLKADGLGLLITFRGREFHANRDYAYKKGMSMHGLGF